tara:strand:- start:656 stop:826 length:171 start_codon:yes stop_codon:yes gene_type:complete
MKNAKGVKVNHYKIALGLAKMFNSSEFECEGIKYVKVGSKYVKVSKEVYNAIKNLK